jgi:small subunit ribosomal protein S9
MSEKSKTVHEAGKRKMAYARATIKEGKGNIRINSMLLDAYGDEILRMRIREPMIIAGKVVDLTKIDVYVNVKGGGYSGQVDAIRTAVSRALISYAAKSKKDSELREKLVEYDRSLVSGDSRRTEPHKPSKSSQGPRAKRQKSYR